MIYTENCKHHKYPVHYMSFSDDVFTKLDMQVQKLIKIIVICYSKPKTWNKWASIFENSTKIKIMMFWFMCQSKMGMETIWMKMLTCRTIVEYWRYEKIQLNIFNDQVLVKFEHSIWLTHGMQTLNFCFKIYIQICRHQATLYWTLSFRRILDNGERDRSKCLYQIEKWFTPILSSRCIADRQIIKTKLEYITDKLDRIKFLSVLIEMTPTHTFNAKSP